MDVYLVGQDGTGWSIDRDRAHVGRALLASGHRLTRTPLRAEVVYCVWWNLLEGLRYRLLRHKRVAATVTNDLTYQEATFARVAPLVDAWVVANSGQRGFLEERGIAPRSI